MTITVMSFVVNLNTINKLEKNDLANIIFECTWLYIRRVFNDYDENLSKYSPVNPQTTNFSHIETSQ